MRLSALWTNSLAIAPMKSTDEVLACMAAMKGERAPEYIRDENGIAQHAINLREAKRREEWYLKDDDELPEHSAPSKQGNGT
jgi:hypothetical protein